MAAPHPLPANPRRRISKPLAGILVAMGMRITLMSVGQCRGATAARLMPHQEGTAEVSAKLPRTRTACLPMPSGVYAESCTRISIASVIVNGGSVKMSDTLSPGLGDYRGRLGQPQGLVGLRVCFRGHATRFFARRCGARPGGVSRPLCAL